MPSKKPKAERDPEHVIEASYIAALERLKDSKPTHAKLRKLAAEGRLNITVASVALEAGRARSGIGHEKCKYGRVRALVLDAMKGTDAAEPRTASGVIGKLREQVKQLTIERDAALSGQTAHYNARLKAERKRNEVIDALERERANAREDSGNVVTLVPKTE